MEIKDANKQFGLSGAYLARLHKEAMRRRKTAVMIVKFANGYEARISVRKVWRP